MLLRIMLTGLGLWAAAGAAAQTDRTVALVMTVGDGAARADAVQAELQALGAETLRADAPGNAQMRSILKRFAREATDARAGLVWLDLPVVAFEGRGYVLPAGVVLERPTDLFTQAIPVRAFARSAQQAVEGGAVVVMAVPPKGDLPDGVTAEARAPEQVTGSAPVVLANPGAFDVLHGLLVAAAGAEEVELGALLSAMEGLDGVSVSGLPATPVFLRQPPQAEPEAPAPAIVEETGTPETLEELTLLEQSLSRSAKRAIQTSLRAQGHYQGLVDGIFGPQTRAAITAFQETRSDDPTGVLTRRQMLDLRS